MRNPYIYIIMYACVATLLMACAGDDVATGGGTPVTRTDDGAVSFSTKLDRETTTRATSGLISDTEGLKAVSEGFGVFAYLTDGTPFNTTDFKNKDHATTSTFSDFFMQNQQVRWGVQYVENDDDDNLSNDVSHYDWVYSPLKYWPNSTDNATNRYISFFAYAPWVDAASSPESGVVNYVRADDRTPHIIYKIGAPDQQVDLLWANAIDATRNGNGLISIGRNAQDTDDSLYFQKVPLEFKHALSAIDIYVQRVYDEPAFTGKIPNAVLYPTIYISKLELTSTAAGADSKNGLQTGGKLSLIDGTWSDDGTWKSGGSGNEVSIVYSERMLNDTISGTLSDDETFIRDIELDKWKWILDTKGTPDTRDDEWVDATLISEDELAATPNRWKNAYGLSEEERNLIKNSMTQVLIPRKVTLIPTLTYSMVVRDDNLQLNYLTDSEGHRYDRILNEVEGNSVTLDLVAGKRYTLLIRVGVEHVTFELVSIVDWDFPMRFRPSLVNDFEKDEIGKIVNEED